MTTPVNAELAEIQEVLQFYDSKGDGKVDVSQVASCLRALGLTPTEAQVASLTQQWTDKDSRISVEELTPICRKVKKDNKNAINFTEEQLAACLSNFDREGNGLIPVHELKFLLANCGEKMKEEETVLLLAGCPEADVNLTFDGDPANSSFYNFRLLIYINVY
uniref:EF-hand domain-containing protein n=1 Tax=Ditylenchus dipsaci TaxID=166011 RepID=A0A915E2K4_9BILA